MERYQANEEREQEIDQKKDTLSMLKQDKKEYEIDRKQDNRQARLLRSKQHKETSTSAKSNKQSANQKESVDGAEESQDRFEDSIEASSEEVWVDPNLEDHDRVEDENVQVDRSTMLQSAAGNSGADGSKASAKAFSSNLSKELKFDDLQQDLADREELLDDLANKKIHERDDLEEIDSRKGADDDVKDESKIDGTSIDKVKEGDGEAGDSRGRDGRQSQLGGDVGRTGDKRPNATPTGLMPTIGKRHAALVAKKRTAGKQGVEPSGKQKAKDANNESNTGLVSSVGEDDESALEKALESSALEAKERHEGEVNASAEVWVDPNLEDHDRVEDENVQVDRLAKELFGGPVNAGVGGSKVRAASYSRQLASELRMDDQQQDSADRKEQQDDLAHKKLFERDDYDDIDWRKSDDLDAKDESKIDGTSIDKVKEGDGESGDSRGRDQSHNRQIAKEHGESLSGRSANVANGAASRLAQQLASRGRVGSGGRMNPASSNARAKGKEKGSSAAAPVRQDADRSVRDILDVSDEHARVSDEAAAQYIVELEEMLGISFRDEEDDDADESVSGMVRHEVVEGGVQPLGNGAASLGSGAGGGGEFGGGGGQDPQIADGIADYGNEQSEGVDSADVARLESALRGDNKNESRSGRMSPTVGRESRDKSDVSGYNRLTSKPRAREVPSQPPSTRFKDTAGSDESLQVDSGLEGFERLPGDLAELQALVDQGLLELDETFVKTSLEDEELKQDGVLTAHEIARGALVGSEGSGDSSGEGGDGDGGSDQSLREFANELDDVNEVKVDEALLAQHGSDVLGPSDAIRQSSSELQPASKSYRLEEMLEILEAKVLVSLPEKGTREQVSLFFKDLGAFKSLQLTLLRESGRLVVIAQGMDPQTEAAIKGGAARLLGELKKKLQDELGGDEVVELKGRSGKRNANGEFDEWFIHDES